MSLNLIRSLEDPAKQGTILKDFVHILNSGKYAEGEFMDKAEDLLMGLLNQYARGLNSCGSALYVLFRYYESLGHRNVVVQNNTFFATGAMAYEAGLNPWLCDSRPDCPSMSVDSMIEVLQVSGARLVCLTHVGGWLAKDYHRIAEYCQENQIVLVEDCAHAFGVYGAGQLGQAACWSFYPTKAVPIGEGGALSTNDLMLLDYVHRFRNYGKSNLLGKTLYSVGMNLRMSEFNAAVLCTQIETLTRTLELRRLDAQVLEQVVGPCLLQGESNYYKYPVANSQAQGLKTVGKVYGRSDQLDTCLPVATTSVPLNNSHTWADGHSCIPCGEGLYRYMNADQVRDLLKETV